MVEIARRTAVRSIDVIETDGANELANSLKVAYHGAGMTGLDLTRNSLDEALLVPGVVAR